MSDTGIEAKRRFVYIKESVDLIIMCISISNEHHNDNNHQAFKSLPTTPYLTILNTMAGAAVIEALGLIGTGLGIIQFGMDNLAPDVKGTTVGIKAGDGKGASNTLVSSDFIMWLHLKH
jgi:hypothetical protein